MSSNCSSSNYSDSDCEMLGKGAFARVIGAGEGLVQKVYNDVDENVSTEINTLLKIRKNRIKFYDMIDALNFGVDIKSCLITMKAYDVNYTTNTTTITLKKMDMTLLEFGQHYRSELYKKWDVIVTHIALQLGIALLEMKCANIIHGDLKPDNVMLKFTKGMPTKKNIKWLDGMVLKMIDFNKSVVGDSVLKTTGIQTFYYASPDIVLGNREYTHHVDMWAVGCIICELLLDRPLFNPIHGDVRSNNTNDIEYSNCCSYNSSSRFSYGDDELDNMAMLHLWTQVLGPIRNPVGRFVDKYFHRTSEESDEWVLNGDVLCRDGVGLSVLEVPNQWLPVMNRIFTYNKEKRINLVEFIQEIINMM